MKKFLRSGFFIVLISLLSVTLIKAQNFAKGADVGWLSQMEAAGRIFYNSNGLPQDCIQILKDKGINAIRLRVWMNPTGGWCGTTDVVAQAIRAKNRGMKIMIDFHYSDSWADPGQQNKPAAWVGLSLDSLVTTVYNYTFSVMTTLLANGVIPTWVQVGNETNNGMLWEDGKASIHMNNFARMVTAGYDAVKAVSSTSKVIVHISNGYDNSLFRWMFDGLTSNNAKWDVIGMSLYPTTANWQTLNNQCLANMNDMISRYNKEIMLSEVGMDVSPAPTAKRFLSDLIIKVKSLANNKGLGVFYWEPEAYNNWQGYTKGAFDMTGKPTVAMDAFLENNAPAPGTNYLLNGSFDADAATQTPQSWSESGTPAASYTASGGGWNADGTYYLGHYQAAAYQVRTFQTVSVPNGHYHLSAWAIRGTGHNSAQMYANGFGGAELTADITYNNAWSLVTIPDINVTNGQVTVGFYSNANAGNWLDIDSVRLIPLSALPVSLISFNTALQPNGQVKLFWKTASEINNKSYIIQRSTDGSNYTEIGTVPARTAVGGQFDYTFIDYAPIAKSTNYYRLIQEDKDGRKTSLGVRLVNTGGIKNGLSIYPNPTTNTVFITYQGLAGKAVTVQLLSLDGKKIFTKQLTSASDELKVNLPSLSKGQYYINVISGNEIYESRKINIK